MRTLTQIIDAVEAELAGGPAAELSTQERDTLTRAMLWLGGHVDGIPVDEDGDFFPRKEG